MPFLKTGQYFPVFGWLKPSHVPKICSQMERFWGFSLYIVSAWPLCSFHNVSKLCSAGSSTLIPSSTTSFSKKARCVISVFLLSGGNRLGSRNAIYKTETFFFLDPFLQDAIRDVHVKGVMYKWIEKDMGELSRALLQNPFLCPVLCGILQTIAA